MRLLLPFCILAATALTSPAAHPAAGPAIEQAHAETWRRFVDPHGIVRDFAGELPTPEDCTLGRPNAIGWWSPIENGPMFTGLYLHAMVERARRSGNPADQAEARRLSQGLLKCASVSDVPGFVARGIGTDGRCHYPLSSDDQMHPWFLGLHAFFTSGIPDPHERAAITAKVREVAGALESHGWRVPCDGAFKGQFRGGFRGELFRDAVRYLHLLRVTHEITGENVWLERYQMALAQSPAPAGPSRLEICAGGCMQDRTAIPHLEKSQFWIYVGCQAGLATLASMESDPAAQAAFRAGLLANAQLALPALESHVQFDNADTQHFGSADWRAAHPTWFPQPTQEDARRLSELYDPARRGTRKNYEAAWMRNPLAAAAIVALGSGGPHRESVLKALRHYDYQRLHMAEFFLAEFAYYALPRN